MSDASHFLNCRGLHFTENKVIKTNLYPPYTWQKSAFLLDGCRDVLIKNNAYDKEYTTRTILIEYMNKSDVKFDKNQGFTIGFIPIGLNTYFDKSRYQ
jgi:hypothetical protein